MSESEDQPDEQQKPARKKRTRGNRDGKPYKRGKGWCAKAYYPNGKVKYCYGKTSKEAADKRKKFYSELEAGGPITVGKGVSVARYMQQWLDDTLTQRVAAGRLSPGTLDSYREKAELHIIPELGKIPLAELAPGHLRPWLTALQKKPSARTPRKPRPGETKPPPVKTLAPRTVAYCHAILRKALADAMNDELVKRNVAKLVDPPVVEQVEMSPPTKDEARALLAAAADDRLWVYWLVVLALGLRRGEGLGLRWEDVDFKNKTIKVQKSVQRLRGEVNPDTGRRKGKLVAKSLKTQASKAVLPVPASAIEVLAEYQEQQAEQRKKAKVWADPGLVFCTRVGTQLEPRNVNRSWEAVCRRSEIGRSVRIHDLRHAAGTYLFEAGTEMKVIQKTLRHTRLSTTADVYVHVFEETQRAAADQMDNVLIDLGARRARKRGVVVDEGVERRGEAGEGGVR